MIDYETSYERGVSCDSIDQPGDSHATSVVANNITMSRLNEEMSALNDIAEGSFGVVKQGHLDLDQRCYAVKQTKKVITGEGDLQQRLQEVYALSVCGHENILRYYDGWVEDRAVYVRTEFVPGGSIAQFPRPVTEPILRQLLYQISSALHHLHVHGIAHRDVKPENVLVRHLEGEQYLFKLCDFGLSRPLKREATDTGELFRCVNDDDGDRDYLCPEAFSACDAPQVGCEADVYALGATCVELMGGDPHLVRSGEFTGSLKQYSPEIRSLICAMTAQDPGERPSAFMVAASTMDSAVRDSDAIMQRQKALEDLRERIAALESEPSP